MLYTMAGSWLECSEYEATIKENRDFISSLLSSHDQQLRQRIVEGGEKLKGYYWCGDHSKMVSRDTPAGMKAAMECATCSALRGYNNGIADLLTLITNLK